MTSPGLTRRALAWAALGPFLALFGWKGQKPDDWTERAETAILDVACLHPPGTMIFKQDGAWIVGEDHQPRKLGSAPRGPS